MKKLALLSIFFIGFQVALQAQVQLGLTVFKKQCASCHKTQANKHGVGPSLFGIYGKKAGTTPGFKFSPALSSSGLVWTDQNLRPYITDPKGFVVGGRHAIAGVKKANEAEALIDYLKTLR